MSREESFEEHQIVRDLEAARERETDLSEQLRFAEEEIRKVKRRLKESQAENDILSKKMGKIVSLQVRILKKKVIKFRHYTFKNVEVYLYRMFCLI